MPVVEGGKYRSSRRQRKRDEELLRYRLDPERISPDVVSGTLDDDQLPGAGHNTEQWPDDMSVFDMPGAADAASTMQLKEDEGWRPRIVAFCCHWCTYTGADLAGLNRMNYPADVRVLRVPCSGRINPQFVIEALNKGCDAVLVCGCHPGDCHYVSGNYYTRRRMLVFKRLLEFEGLEPERFQVRWISGAEAGKFRDTVTEVCEQVRKLGPLHAGEIDFAAAADGLKGGAGA
jgi:coenzyme F420-reducing hydrogenase delta subunit